MYVYVLWGCRDEYCDTSKICSVSLSSHKEETTGDLQVYGWEELEETYERADQWVASVVDDECYWETLHNSREEAEREVRRGLGDEYVAPKLLLELL